MVRLSLKIYNNILFNFWWLGKFYPTTKIETNSVFDKILKGFFEINCKFLEVSLYFLELKILNGQILNSVLLVFTSYKIIKFFIVFQLKTKWVYLANIYMNYFELFISVEISIERFLSKLVMNR